MTREELVTFFDYDPQTGEFTRLDRKNGNGSIDYYGYLVLKIKGRQYKGHRLAWLYVYGEMPKGVIDHINGQKLDNRIENLRDVLQRDNCRNMTLEPNKDTGCKGIHIDRTNGLKKKYAFSFNSKTFRFYTAAEAKAERTKLLRGAGYGERHI